MLIVGVSAILAGAVVLAFVNAAPVPLCIAGTVLLGIGLGAVMQNIVVAPQNRAPLEHVGSVTPTVLFMFTLGGSIGLVVFGAVVSALVEGPVAAGTLLSEAYLSAMPVVFLVGAAVVLPALVCVLALPAIRLKSAADVVATPEAKPVV